MKRFSFMLPLAMMLALSPAVFGGNWAWAASSSASLGGIAFVAQTKSSTARKRPSAAARRRAAAAAAKAKAAAQEKVGEQLKEPSESAVEQPGALVPFFEQLYRRENSLAFGPVSILQFGDSHTAADVWTNSLRASFQSRFGDGGSGFSHAGKPWRGYRRFDLSGSASSGWTAGGLVGKASLRGDEFQGLSGVSVQTSKRGEWISVTATASRLDVFYLQQPEGGRILLYDNDQLLAEHSTNGEMGPGILELETTLGEHTFRIETVDSAPVRLFGWVTERSNGVTWEPLGINGAEASITGRWDTSLFESFVARRDPSLVVVAYGTNEAGHPAWDYEKYFQEFDRTLRMVRAAAPSASILVLGPPDRLWYQRRRGWREAPRLDIVIRAQRAAAARNRAAFWDTRARMGGEGSMRDWVKAGLARRDYVHFSADGYQRLGEALYQDLMIQYNEFQKLRRQWTADVRHDPTTGYDPRTRPESLQEDRSTGY